MTNPKLSIVVPTMRAGGLDILFAGLANQTCKDFELVLVDAIMWPREAAFTTLRGKIRFPDSFEFRHLDPRGNGFPRNEYCRSVNTGIAAALGEVVLLLVDYTWLSPTFVERHLALHAENPNRVVLSPHRSVQPRGVDPRIRYRTSLEHYSNEGLDDYVADLEAGLLDDLAWSIFAPALTLETGAACAAFEPEDRFGGPDPKYQRTGPLDDHLLFYCRSESVRREHLLALNGFDEDLDGSHGYQDSDMADRLRKVLGLEFYCEPACEAVIVNPRPYFPHARRERSIDSNRLVWEGKRSAGYPRVRGIAELP